MTAVAFCGAFLLFLVQPLMGKALLPWFGGSAAVWSATLLFFQAFLVAGYGLAWALDRAVRPRARAWVLLALAAVALATLPILPHDAWRPGPESRASLRILATLLVSVGLPYLLLATVAPTVSTWIESSSPYSPYRLYAASNIGSLAALLSYPLVFEPTFAVDRQATLWSFAFAAFAIVYTVLAWRMGPQTPSASRGGQGSIAWGRWTAWIGLPALASVMLLAVTNTVCRTLVVVPLFWTVPLALFLLTFVIAFARESRATPRGLALLTVLLMAAVALRAGLAVPYAVLLQLAALFVLSLLCHTEIVRTRPSPSRLTLFYFLIATGGALGCLFVSLVGPIVFTTYAELDLAVYAGATLGLLVLSRPYRRAAIVGLTIAWSAVTIAAVVVRHDKPSSWRKRTFFGVLRVEESETYRSLFHGGILHGLQYTAAERRQLPTTYYDTDSGISRLIRSVGQGRRLRVGLVGLGVGTLAAYGRPGDVYRIYEIDPAVVDVARERFTFVADSKATIDIETGDARVLMQRDPPQEFDILVLDAFSGNSVPAHLLTREAFELWAHHLSTSGVIAVNASSRVLDLERVVAAAAREVGLHGRTVHSNGGRPPVEAPSDWVLLSRDEELFHAPTLAATARPIAGPPVLWTDRRSSPLSVMK